MTQRSDDKLGKPIHDAYLDNGDEGAEQGDHALAVTPEASLCELYLRRRVHVEFHIRVRHRVDPDIAANELAAELARTPGIEAAFSRSQIQGGRLPDTDVARAVRRNFNPARSGDVHVVPRPGWQLAYEGETSSRYATGHGTPWRYDSWVPVIFFGPGVDDGVVKRRIETIDVVPTAAALAGVEAPASATGKVLAEAID